jgi:hypothetical protein
MDGYNKVNLLVVFFLKPPREDPCLYKNTFLTNFSLSLTNHPTRKYFKSVSRSGLGLTAMLNNAFARYYCGKFISAHITNPFSRFQHSSVFILLLLHFSPFCNVMSTVLKLERV